jgi:hypothetical protein
MSAEWLFLVALNERLRPLRDPVQIQEVAVRLIGEHLQASRVNYAQIVGNAFVIKQSYTRSVPPFAGRGELARFGKAIVDACRRGETVVISDVQADARFTELIMCHRPSAAAIKDNIRLAAMTNGTRCAGVWGSVPLFVLRRAPTRCDSVRGSLHTEYPGCH